MKLKVNSFAKLWRASSEALKRSFRWS